MIQRKNRRKKKFVQLL